MVPRLIPPSSLQLPTAATTTKTLTESLSNCASRYDRCGFRVEIITAMAPRKKAPTPDPPPAAEDEDENDSNNKNNNNPINLSNAPTLNGNGNGIAHVNDTTNGGTSTGHVNGTAGGNDDPGTTTPSKGEANGNGSGITTTTAPKGMVTRRKRAASQSLDLEVEVTADKDTADTDDGMTTRSKKKRKTEASTGRGRPKKNKDLTAADIRNTQAAAAGTAVKQDKKKKAGGTDGKRSGGSSHKKKGTGEKKTACTAEKKKDSSANQKNNGGADGKKAKEKKAKKKKDVTIVLDEDEDMAEAPSLQDPAETESDNPDEDFLSNSQRETFDPLKLPSFTLNEENPLMKVDGPFKDTLKAALSSYHSDVSAILNLPTEADYASLAPSSVFSVALYAKFLFEMLQGVTLSLNDEQESHRRTLKIAKKEISSERRKRREVELRAAAISDALRKAANKANMLAQQKLQWMITHLREAIVKNIASAMHHGNIDEGWSFSIGVTNPEVVARALKVARCGDVCKAEEPFVMGKRHFVAVFGRLPTYEDEDGYRYFLWGGVRFRYFPGLVDGYLKCWGRYDVVQAKSLIEDQWTRMYREAGEAYPGLSW